MRSLEFTWLFQTMGHHDHMFKVLIIGDATVGKTSLVQRYANDSFNKHYKSTVGGELFWISAPPPAAAPGKATSLFAIDDEL